MDFLTYTVLIASAGAALAVVSLLTLPTTLVVVNEIVILTNKAEVFQTVTSLGKFHTWCPSFEADPMQKHFMRGQDGQIGSKYTWQGVAKRSAGCLTLTNLRRDDYAAFQFQIIEPRASQPLVEYYFEPHSNTHQDITNVKVVYTQKTSRPFNLISRLSGLKHKIEMSNGRSLTKLKQVIEASAFSTPKR